MDKQKIQTQSKYYSQTWNIPVRPSIAREFTQGKFFDDNLAGLHEIRLRRQEKKGKKSD